MQFAGWKGIGGYLLILAIIMIRFSLNCEEIGCLAMAVIPSMPGIILLLPLTQLLPDPIAPLFGTLAYFVSIILNFVIAYWIGVAISLLIKKRKEDMMQETVNK